MRDLVWGCDWSMTQAEEFDTFYLYMRFHLNNENN